MGPDRRRGRRRVDPALGSPGFQRLGWAWGCGRRVPAGRNSQACSVWRQGVPVSWALSSLWIREEPQVRFQWAANGTLLAIPSRSCFVDASRIEPLERSRAEFSSSPRSVDQYEQIMRSKRVRVENFLQAGEEDRVKEVSSSGVLQVEEVLLELLAAKT